MTLEFNVIRIFIVIKKMFWGLKQVVFIKLGHLGNVLLSTSFFLVKKHQRINYL